jgi:hypothetical protein
LLFQAIKTFNFHQFKKRERERERERERKQIEILGGEEIY